VDELAHVEAQPGQSPLDVANSVTAVADAEWEVVGHSAKRPGPKIRPGS